MFAVMGITGNVGGAVADTLLQHGQEVRGIVRDPGKAAAWRDKGVELVTADYDDALTEALRGVEGVFAMIPPNILPDPGYPDSVARVAALKKSILAANPPRAVYLSSIGSEKDSGLGLITATHILEEELNTTGIPSAFLRASSFMENNLHSIPAARATGNYFAFYQPLDRAYPLIATDDIGRIAAETLLQSWQGNRFLELSGPAQYSSNDIAAAMSKALGKPVSAVAVPKDTWPAALANFGMPTDRSGAYLEMLHGVNTGWIDFGVAGTEPLRGTIDLDTNMKALAARTA